MKNTFYASCFKYIVAKNIRFVFVFIPWHVSLYEPPRDKTSNVAVRPAKTQTNLGIYPVWSESSLSAWRKLGSLATHWVHN